MRTIATDRMSEILFGQTRGAVLGLLFGHTDQSFYIRQIARDTGISTGALQRELEQLAEIGLISRTKIGNQVFYQANAASPVFQEIRSLVAKTVGIIKVLRSALEPLASRIQFAFVFGSIARREETAASDIDLMIIGDTTFDEILRAISPAQTTLTREINPSIYSPAEFKAKLKKGNHFLTTIVKSEKLFVIGTEDELRNLGSKRVA